MKLALFALASLALALVPVAAADTSVCQPVVVEYACVVVWTGAYGLTGAEVCVLGPLSVCAGAVHAKYLDETENSVGAGACVVGTVCAGESVRQLDDDQRFIVGTEGGVYTPAATHWQQIFVGTNNNSPYRYVALCPWTTLTGGTCLIA